MYRALAFGLCVLSTVFAGCAGDLGVEQGGTVADLSSAECAGAAPWLAGKQYGIGNAVRFEGSVFSCAQAHTSLSTWTPKAAPALWSTTTCGNIGGANPGTGTGNTGGGSNTGGGGNTGGGTNTCNPNAWVAMTPNANACVGHIGESCGWTATNLGQNYHCQKVSWGVGCAPGGATCSGGGSTGGGSTGGGSSGGGSSGGGSSGGGGTGSNPGQGQPPVKPAGPVMFGAYKDTGINFNGNTNVVSTSVSGSFTSFASDYAEAGGKTATLAFAVGECGNETWAGVSGDAIARANVDALSKAGVDYVISTGGAAGVFSCGSDAGMSTFIDRWMSPHLVGVDFDIEAGQSSAVISDLVKRIKAAHLKYPDLRFTLTLATSATSKVGSTVAASLGAAAPVNVNVLGTTSIDAVRSVFGFNGSAASWPAFITVNLMTMDYGSVNAGICVVSGGACQMGQSAIQAAFNLRDRFGIPFSSIEVTPMIGRNDVAGEVFTLSDANAVAQFAIKQGLAGVHYWSYDRDRDCPPGPASATCNSIGNAGTRGFLARFRAAGLR